MLATSRPSTKFRRLVLLLALVAATPGSGPSPAQELPSGWTPKKAVISKHDMVAAANPLAVEAGYAVLREGGSAIDAAVAVQMVLNIVELAKGTRAVALKSKLEALGHETEVMDHTSGLQSSLRTRTGWIGGADPRREGTAKGH